MPASLSITRPNKLPSRMLAGSHLTTSPSQPSFLPGCMASCSTAKDSTSVIGQASTFHSIEMWGDHVLDQSALYAVALQAACAAGAQAGVVLHAKLRSFITRRFFTRR